ncbi:MAG TPA: cyclic nucleotide-binding domain-containing protein, partial [Pseudorhizobium sp.]|nr:cyclic nucleotide-binding domain-containing protein [Pseudorhizobium sp.]
MADSASDIAAFVESVHPYDSLPRDELRRVIRQFEPRSLKAGSKIYALNEHLPGLFLIMDGSVEVRDSSDSLISQLFPRNTLGE